MSEANRLERCRVPTRRVVLIGASNLVHGMLIVVETARRMWGEPVDLLAAHGLGRSYGMNSRVFARRLPSILNCGLWDALKQRNSAPTTALVTDIGNDLIYGASVEQVAGWVEQCLERLSQHAERIVVTELPLESVAKLDAWRFLLIRSFCFPFSRLTLPEAIDNSRQLNERIKQSAARFDARLIQPKPHWYGFDPIHIRLRYRREAWREILAACSDDELPLRSRASLRSWFLLRFLRPQQRHLFGIEQRRTQPAATLDDGTSISFF